MKIYRNAKHVLLMRRGSFIVVDSVRRGFKLADGINNSGWVAFVWQWWIVDMKGEVSFRTRFRQHGPLMLSVGRA